MSRAATRSIPLLLCFLAFTSCNEHSAPLGPADAADADADGSVEDVIDGAEASSSCPAFRVPNPDPHCTDPEGGAIVVPVDPSQCAAESDGGTGDASLDESSFAAETPVELDDDECKLHVVMRRACAAAPGTMNFLVSAALRSDSTPAAGAAPYIEAFLDLTHIAPNTHATTSEIAPGTYTIGPVLLDRPGLWTVVLHFYGSCLLIPGSAHAHATFSMNVP